jgi:SAM-dependent methyltransferase
MVVEHLHDPGSVLRQMKELLKPTGRLMISVPNTDCWELRALGRYNFILNEPTHLQHFSVDSIGRLLDSAGLDIESIDYQKNAYNIVGSVGIWLKSRFPNRKLGRRLLAFCDNPSMWGRLALAPLAKLLAAIRQSGRITIIAKPRQAPHTTETTGPSLQD